MRRSYRDHALLMEREKKDPSRRPVSERKTSLYVYTFIEVLYQLQ